MNQIKTNEQIPTEHSGFEADQPSENSIPGNRTPGQIAKDVFQGGQPLDTLTGPEQKELNELIGQK